MYSSFVDWLIIEKLYIVLTWNDQAKVFQFLTLVSECVIVVFKKKL